jgi:hypothetical protein
MAMPTIRSDEAREKFLAALRTGLSIANAAQAAGFGRGAAYVWRKEDPLFAADWDEAIEFGTDLLEDEARRRAMAGSDALIMFMLKARRPQQYKDRASFEHTGPSGGAVQIEDIGNPREELLRRINEIHERNRHFEELEAQKQQAALEHQDAFKQKRQGLQ